MHIVNITELRRHAGKIITRVVRKNEPAIILQRSKPVVYIVEASFFESLQQKLEELEKKRDHDQTNTALHTIEQIREKMILRGEQPDSSLLIREIREGIHRHE